MEYQVESIPGATIVKFEVPGGIYEPSDLAQLTLPAVDTSLGVILSGRGPEWLYAVMAHHYHHYYVAAWVAMFDYRTGEGVVVSCQAPSGPAVGSVVQVPKFVSL